MISEGRTAIYRKQIALRTIGQGKTSDADFSAVFDLITKKIRDFQPRMSEQDADADIAFINVERDHFMANPVRYIQQMEDLLEKEKAAPQPPAPAQPAASTAHPQLESGPADIPTAIPERRLPGLKGILGLVAGLLAVAWLLGLGGFSCGVIRKTCYDSGWIEVDNKATKVWSFSHGMSFTPSEVTLLFRPPGDQQSIYPVSSYGGNPINIEITPQQINVHVFSGSPLRSIFNASTGQWQAFTNGQYRVISR